LKDYGLAYLSLAIGISFRRQIGRTYESSLWQFS